MIAIIALKITNESQLSIDSYRDVMECFTQMPFCLTQGFRCEMRNTCLSLAIFNAIIVIYHLI